jgi:hypothetical protein
MPSPLPQEATDRVNHLGTAKGQPKLLTFYDRKGRLIGETENPQVPDIVDTTVPDDEDGLEDLNPPTINHDAQCAQQSTRHWSTNCRDH